MLEVYFVKPETVDRIGRSWIGADIERYVVWMSEHDYSHRCVWRRVPLLVAFGEFARQRGAQDVGELPAHLEAFIAERVGAHRGHRKGGVNELTKEVRGPIEQMLRLVVPSFAGTGRKSGQDPFVDVAPGFFDYLASERGLRPATMRLYRDQLHRFEDYLGKVGVTSLREVTPLVLSAFVADRAAAGLARVTVRGTCAALRVFLRYAFREGLIGHDLSSAVEWPQYYRLSSIPRSISWDEVGRVLAEVDRRTPCGKRDYAILLLLVTYGLRSREVAALRLDDIDWKRERLAVPERKAGHSTAFPLSTSVGEALIDYLQHGRPQTSERELFFRALAPQVAITAAGVSARARHYLLKAGINVPRPGSHTLRHSCVQRLVDADFGWKTIGDFVGHRSPTSTSIYTKVAVESLRQIALGDGEEVLS